MSLQSDFTFEVVPNRNFNSKKCLKVELKYSGCTQSVYLPASRTVLVE